MGRLAYTRDPPSRCPCVLQLNRSSIGLRSQHDVDAHCLSRRVGDKKPRRAAFRRP
jgi:hypothetical protein